MRIKRSQENGHPSYLDQKRSGFLLTNTNHKKNGTSSLNKSNSEKADTSFPSHESIVAKNAQSKGGGKLSFHFYADGDTIETVFRSSAQFLRSSLRFV